MSTTLRRPKIHTTKPRSFSLLRIRHTKSLNQYFDIRDGNIHIHRLCLRYKHPRMATHFSLYYSTIVLECSNVLQRFAMCHGVPWFSFLMHGLSWSWSFVPATMVCRHFYTSVNSTTSGLEYEYSILVQCNRYLKYTCYYS
jgi:hypothetical protein